MSSNGPIVEIQLWVSDALQNVLISANQAVPQPIRATAMIDTGASRTVITPSIVQSLSIQPVGVAHMITPSTTTPVPCHEYDVRILFPSNVITPTIAIEASLIGQHIQCLIGRDILSRGVLIYIGYTNTFTLSF